MSRLISRDPFARTELHKVLVRSVVGGTTCAWCGQKDGRGRLYQFRTESDSGRVYEHRGLFCSKACHDSYHL